MNDDIDNCPDIANPGQEDADGDSVGDVCDSSDSDGDGYVDSAESMYIGTQAETPCGPDWPSNLLDNGLSTNKLDIQDIIAFVAPVRRLDTSPPDDAAYSPRWDIQPGPNVPFVNHINIIDLTALTNGPTAHPAMFGGLSAWNRTCTFDP